VLVIAEPAVTTDASAAKLRALVDGAPNVLVVLPKWYGSSEVGHDWIEDANLLEVTEIDPVLKALGITSTVTRLEHATHWTVEAGTALPDIREPQLVKSDSLSSRVEDPDGNQLLAVDTTGSHPVWLLSDPDVLNNYGLRHGDNARFTVELLDQLRAGGPVVIDETLHGYAQQPSLSRTLLRFPLVLATMQVIACALLAIWAAAVRFGPKREAPPPLAPGKDFLIRNTAALLAYGGHHGHALRRYLHLTVGAVRHMLHAPQLAPAAATEWLERVRKQRGGAVSLVELEQRIDQAAMKRLPPQTVVELADQVYRWRMEMTHGTDHRS
jgi:hypothetical protein